MPNNLDRVVNVVGNKDGVMKPRGLLVLRRRSTSFFSIPTIDQVVERGCPRSSPVLSRKEAARSGEMDQNGLVRLTQGSRRQQPRQRRRPRWQQGQRHETSRPFDFTQVVDDVLLIFLFTFLGDLMATVLNRFILIFLFPYSGRSPSPSNTEFSSSLTQSVKEKEKQSGSTRRKRLESCLTPKDGMDVFAPYFRRAVTSNVSRLYVEHPAVKRDARPHHQT
ncbi:uncharacterized protein PV06_08311 [Exophiala oligosperma]|uniref:Uncharacterized protein n=1 Tax=Exophiala oligosperma TaxID=215243 RepID=A0A0D2BQB2_9EURO|nr:uncharacterized protein PV06_08311 [Exophiala oligosperma]KIW39722.1 hypothetical protein PV06_08311 [Exophiala oligosperma]